MIDLRTADLLEVLLLLPYTLVRPDTLFGDEWLCLTEAEKQLLQHLGLEVPSFSGEFVHRIVARFNEHPLSSLKDCFALTLAEVIGGCIPLAGDGPLRRIAESNDIHMHGVLRGSQTSSRLTKWSHPRSYTQPSGCCRTTSLCSSRPMKSRSALDGSNDGYGASGLDALKSRVFPPTVQVAAQRPWDYWF